MYTKKRDYQEVQFQLYITTKPQGLIKLSQWIRADSGNDYTKVLIKKGTWQSGELLYTKTMSGAKKYYAGVDLSKTKTKVVIGEVGSKIYFKVDPTSMHPVYGLHYNDSTINSNLTRENI